jgi:MYXO-CTERM domain-containing protein
MLAKFFVIPAVALGFSATFASAAVVSVRVNNWGTPQSQTFSLKLAGDTTITSVPASGFRINIAGGADTLAVCIELGQTISTANSTNNFENATPLANAARGSGTGSGNATSLITPGPTGTGVANRGANVVSGIAGGIRDIRAAQIRFLFDTYWKGNNLASWTTNSTTSITEIPAFQLAVWELSHDTNFRLTNQSAYPTEFYVNNPGALTGNALTSYNRAASMVAAVQAANVQASYASKTWQVVLLENSSFAPSPANGTVQDLVYATAIPEATTAMLTLAGLTLLATRRRRRSAWSRAGKLRRGSPLPLPGQKFL